MLLLIKNVTSPLENIEELGVKDSDLRRTPGKTQRPSLTALRTRALPYVFGGLWLPEMDAQTGLKSRPPRGDDPRH